MKSEKFAHRICAHCGKVMVYNSNRKICPFCHYELVDCIIRSKLEMHEDIDLLKEGIIKAEIHLT